MLIVYVLQSLKKPDRYYIGLATDLQARLAAHNDGKSLHTAKFRPWKLIVAVHFESRAKAEAFERYLKSGSGRAFCRRHF